MADSADSTTAPAGETSALHPEEVARILRGPQAITSPDLASVADTTDGAAPVSEAPRRPEIVDHIACRLGVAKALILSMVAMVSAGDRETADTLLFEAEEEIRQLADYYSEHSGRLAFGGQQ